MFQRRKIINLFLLQHCILLKYAVFMDPVAHVRVSDFNAEYSRSIHNIHSDNIDTRYLDIRLYIRNTYGIV